MEFEAMTCPRCGANLPYSELTSGRQIIQCQVCRACMESPRYGEFKGPEPAVLHMPSNGAGASPTGGDSEAFKEELRRRREERRREALPREKRYRVVGQKRTGWMYLTVLGIISTTILTGMMILEVAGMGMCDMIHPEYGFHVLAGALLSSLIAMSLVGAMPSWKPVYEEVQ